MRAVLATRWLVAAAVALVTALLCAPVAADVVHLKNGQTLEGVVVETDREVAIRSAVGELRLPVALVERIERGESLEDQALRRLGQMPRRDLEGRLALAMELDQAGANTLSRRILAEVLEIDPDHPGARRALGYVRCDGEWLSDADCHGKRGEVLHQGRWISAADRTMLETLDLQRRQVELERLHARIQIDSARLEADRLSSAMAGQEEEPFGYPYDPYWGGGVFYPPYPVYPYGVFDPSDPFDPIHGGRHFGRDGRFDWNDGRHGLGRGGRPGFDGRHHRFDDGLQGFRGPLHHRGGQPPRPLVPRHVRSRLAPQPAGPVAPPRPIVPTPGS